MFIAHETGFTDSKLRELVTLMTEQIVDHLRFLIAVLTFCM